MRKSIFVFISVASISFAEINVKSIQLVIGGQPTYATGQLSQDATPFFEKAAELCTQSGEPIFIPSGQYKLTNGLNGIYDIPKTGVTPGSKKGLIIRGENRRATEIHFITNNKVLFNLYGENQKSSYSISNLTLFSKGNGNIALKLRGVIWGEFESLDVNDFETGILMSGFEVPGSAMYSEANTFRNIWLNSNKAGIHLVDENGGKNASFHGTVFEKVCFNVGENQIGLKHSGGRLYNSRLDFLFWTEFDNATMIEANGLAELNQGTITTEPQHGKNLYIRGSGEFSFKGTLQSTEPALVVNQTIGSDRAVFRCDNYPVDRDNSNQKISGLEMVTKSGIVNSSPNEKVQVIKFNNILLGRIYLNVDNQDNVWDPSSVFDVHYHPGVGHVNLYPAYNQAYGWDPATGNKIRLSAGFITEGPNAPYLVVSHNDTKNLKINFVFNGISK